MVDTQGPKKLGPSLEGWGAVAAVQSYTNKDHSGLVAHKTQTTIYRIYLYFLFFKLLFN